MALLLFIRAKFTHSLQFSSGGDKNSELVLPNRTPIGVYISLLGLTSHIKRFHRLNVTPPTLAHCVLGAGSSLTKPIVFCVKHHWGTVVFITGVFGNLGISVLFP